MMSLAKRADCSYSIHGERPAFSEVADRQLRALCSALGWDSESARMLDVQRVLFDQWGGYRVPEQPIFPSNIGDDHSPYESSAAFGLWHAACFTRSSEPAFKVYLNPAVHGQAHAWDTVREALRRLG